MPPTIRPATPSDVEAIKRIAVDANMFAADEVSFFDEMLAGFFDGTMHDNHWLVVDNDSAVIAAAYYAPEPFADRMWNLYFIAVDPTHHSQGVGGRLLNHIEGQLRQRGDSDARVLIVETSSTDQYARTRDFYRANSYDEEARIRQFYGPTDDKIIFWKSLAA
jgi:ribosomal protein S18 acetylase RimI-like enzyme